MRIPDNVIDTVRDRVDIVQVVGRHVQLKRAGRNHVGLCPFHNEKSPSFNVSPDKKMFHCFGCGEGGDVFKFLTKATNKTFPEVVKELAAEVGVEVPEREETPEEKAAERARQRLFAMEERALHVFLAELQGPNGVEARAYLEGRNLPQKHWAEFELGFGGAGRDLLWTTLGKTDEDKDDLIKAGLCVNGERGVYDRFAGRVMFPIRDEKFRVIGFGGRVFGDRAKRDGVAKYLNSPESPLYDKSTALYRAPQAFLKARKGAAVVVVEGYFDAIALELSGLAAVASCGTALTPRHAQSLSKLNARVVCCFDGDAAGERAIRRAAESLLPLKVDTRVAVLPIGDDPDTYVARVGATGAARLVEEAEPLPTWVISQAARNAEDAGDDVPQRAEAIRELAWLFQALPEGMERDMYLERAAQKLQVDKATLMRELKAGPVTPPPTVNPPGRSNRPPPPPPRPRIPPKPLGPPALSPVEVTLVHLVATWPDRAQALDEHPLSNGLSQPLRLLLAFVREKVQEAGPFDVASPVFRELRVWAQQHSHPQVGTILDQVARGQRLFANEEDANRAVHEVLEWLRMFDLTVQQTQLQKELQAAEARNDTAAVNQLMGSLQEIRRAREDMRRRRAQASG